VSFFIKVSFPAFNGQLFFDTVFAALTLAAWGCSSHPQPFREREANPLWIQISSGIVFPPSFSPKAEDVYQSSSQHQQHAA
jgi:hypothetical protein